MTLTKTIRLSLFVSCFAAFIGNASAQLSTPDTIKTGKGPLVIQPVEHASVVLTVDKAVIYVDPAGNKDLFKGLAAPDYILITDIHGDHFDSTAIGKLKTANTKLIVPPAVADKLPAAYKPSVIVLKNFGVTTQGAITINAIPMYNLPETAESRHPKGRGNGYIITVGGVRVYLSGDTQGIPEMRNLRNINVAFVCMNQPYTMDVTEAASAVLSFKPKIVYPYHYRGAKGLSDVDAFKEKVDAGKRNIEVRLRNWYPKL
ncbi:MBL fold metallo-hydrolase [Chitinophaga agri]|uniref:MBL fold metallo-hydrolase n=1 Tax=Chitinophaga agri TaxID=2703787 RepID=A0A6B9ZEP6_9BACT|nr:MBL fold metallo-hydrolase [Chitinophaga agri]QHS59981.1 MBL fold metallo-hydrolase [Chitinophaga agri]